MQKNKQTKKSLVDQSSGKVADCQVSVYPMKRHIILSSISGLWCYCVTRLFSNCQIWAAHMVRNSQTFPLASVLRSMSVMSGFTYSEVAGAEGCLADHLIRVYFKTNCIIPYVIDPLKSQKCVSLLSDISSPVSLIWPLWAAENILKSRFMLVCCSLHTVHYILHNHIW